MINANKTVLLTLYSPVDIQHTFIGYLHYGSNCINQFIKMGLNNKEIVKK